MSFSLSLYKRAIPHRWEMADTEPQEVAPGVPDNDLMNALRYNSAHSRTRHPCRIDVIPRARPPDAHLQIPARARQERPIGQSRQPPNQAQRTCLKIALTCILTGVFHLLPALRTSARKAA